MDANRVIGQVSFTTNTGGAAANQVSGSSNNGIGITVTSGELFFSDYNNNRVNAFSSIPSSNGQSADFVVGQTSFPNNSTATTQNGLNGPWYIFSSSSQLFVSDYGNNRVLIYNSIPTASNPSADLVLGQTGFTGSGSGCTQSSMNGPAGVSAGNGKMIVSDSGNHRVLVYNTIPTSTNAVPDLVLGQSNFTTCTSTGKSKLSTDKSGRDGVYAASLNNPGGVWTDGTRVVVSDAGNHRVLIWNSFPTATSQVPDVVLGQASLDTVGANSGGLSAKSLKATCSGTSIGAVTSNGTQLFVTDCGNNRVLAWNSFPTQDFTPADIVIGQQNFTASVVPTSSTITASTLWEPDGIYADFDRLIVGDTKSNRILIYNSQ